MSEYEKLAAWLDAVADAHERFAIDSYRFRPGDADLIFAFAEGDSGATTTASLARFAAEAMRALDNATLTHQRRPTDIHGPRGAGEPDDCSCRECAALVWAEPLRQRMSPQATPPLRAPGRRRGESKEVADEDEASSPVA